MITTEASSTTISWATAITAKARKRLGSAPGSGPAGSGVGWLRSIVEVMWGLRLLGRSVSARSRFRPPSRRGLALDSPVAYNRNRNIGSS